jgi:hypothetical protein
MNPTFIWWKGVVEDRNDPLELGRVKVRILGYHTDDKTEIPTKDLPFAYPAMPINTRPGDVPVGPVEGTWVMGFFLDGEDGQQPVMTHVIDVGYIKDNDSSKGFNDPENTYPSAGKEKGKVENKKSNEVTTNRLARGETDDTYIDNHKSVGKVMIAGASAPFSKNITKFWEEPGLGYGAKYPYNKVEESQSGHVREVDDTPNNERLATVHKSGTLEVMKSNGDRVVKVTGSNFEMVVDDNNIYAEGSINITANTDVNIKGRIVRLDGNQVRINGAQGVLLESPVGVFVSAPFLSTDPKMGGAIMHGAIGSPFVAPAGIPPDSMMMDLPTPIKSDSTDSTSLTLASSPLSGLNSNFSVQNMVKSVLSAGFDVIPAMDFSMLGMKLDMLASFKANVPKMPTLPDLICPISILRDAAGLITDIVKIFRFEDTVSDKYAATNILAKKYLAEGIPEEDVVEPSDLDITITDPTTGELITVSSSYIATVTSATSIDPVEIKLASIIDTVVDYTLGATVTEITASCSALGTTTCTTTCAAGIGTIIRTCCTQTPITIPIDYSALTAGFTEECFEDDK